MMHTDFHPYLRWLFFRPAGRKNNQQKENAFGAAKLPQGPSDGIHKHNTEAHIHA
jgi:hypothetical protein